MNEPLQPLAEYVKHLPPCEWKTEAEFTVHRSVNSRFRIIVEASHFNSIADGFRDIGRFETLSEMGVNVICDDAKEFSQGLIDTMFHHISPHEMMHLIAALEADIEKWHKERSEAFAKNPEIYGPPPTEADKRCTW